MGEEVVNAAVSEFMQGLKIFVGFIIFLLDVGRKRSKRTKSVSCIGQSIFGITFFLCRTKLNRLFGRLNVYLM